jgi:hypothetical protein
VPDWYTARRVAETVYGFKTLIEEGSERVLGAHLVGPHADEVINLFALAIRHDLRYPSGQGRLSSVDLMWRDCAVVQTPVFAPVQETVRWQASRFWPVLSGVAGGA